MKKLVRLLPVILSFIFCCEIVYAAENDLGLWTPVYLKLPITSKIAGQLEVSPRLQENITNINQLLVRSSISYQLTKELSVWQGHVWVTNYIPKFVNENRIWQQLLYKKELGKFVLSNRFRVEERFIENIHGAPVRFRNMFKAAYSLDKNKIWSFVIYDEPFINVSNHFNGPQTGIDQNRFFVGLNKKISTNIDVEGGYLLQYLNLQAPAHDKLNHNILINLYLALPQLL